MENQTAATTINQHLKDSIVFVPTENGKLVSTRSLCLIISTYKDPLDNYTNWIKTRVSQLVFEKDKDYFVTKTRQPTQENRLLIDYLVTFESAIKLAKKEKFKEVADYLEHTYTEIQSTIKAADETQDAPLVPAVDAKDSSIAPDEQSAPAPSKPKSKLQKLIELFGEEEQDEPQPEYGARLEAVEQKVDTILSFFKIANQSLFGGPTDGGKLAFEIASTDALPNSLVGVDDLPTEPETTRAKLVQIVRAYGVYKNIKHRNVWTWLYQELNKQFAFNAAINRVSEKENYLSAVERCGQIENLYLIASRFLIIPESNTSAA